ncbi:hypothetical protein [Chitinilyticum piscinae]|uniref:Uncharacterized protein n=1 Tax=Chitinilyticum piscinae TaxID=2866724 RepID=A0A8J7K7E2_9NEIS|nr:hypothetical protein [Chitinilyticum piscinae]MBE9607903.1 hypothetical protein [Chitinilyticum piscinae]
MSHDLHELAGYTPKREALLLHELVRWDEYNDYEGHCLASWHGRQDCFYLQLQPDEWDALHPGLCWHAPVFLQRYGRLQHCPAGERVPALIRLDGVNYRVQGEVLAQDGENIVLAMPWGHLQVDLNLREPAAMCGQWLRLEGVLQAQWPDEICSSVKG